MPKHCGNSFLCTRTKWLIIFSILILGLGLRLYRVGDNLFWFDEVGVANAAEQPSLRQALAVSQLYIMSMPLDYVVAWGVAQISRTEAVLRLPSIIWGSLTLLAAYFLYREITDDHTAILAIFLLALTPIHIRYSQELKFYAALTFFYVVANYLALISVKRNQPRLWMLFLVITMTGILFHVYTTLVLVNLALWVVMKTHKREFDPKLWNPCVISTAMILIFAVITIILFGKSPSYPSELFGFESAFQVFGGGLGWIPLFPSSHYGFLFGGLCMIFAVIGCIITLSTRSNSFRFVIFPGIFLQASLIILGDAVKQYFALSRQFLILVPFMALLAAIGVENTVRRFTNNNQKLHAPYHIGLFLSMIIILAVSVPVLSQYYRAKRTDTLAVVNWLSANWHDGDTICIDPGYESFTYRYYLQRWGIERDSHQLLRMSESLIPFDVDTCQKNISDVNFFITSNVNAKEAPSLKDEGFQPLYISPFSVIQPQIIWHRSEAPN